MLSFIPSFLFSKWTVLAVAMVGVWVHGFSWGNDIGTNARKYRAVIAELQTKNAMLTAQLAEDARIEAEEARAAAVADAEFAKAVPGLKPLPVDQKTADALNALIGE